MEEYKLLTEISVRQTINVSTVGGPEQYLYSVFIGWDVKHSDTDATSFSRQTTCSMSEIGPFIAKALEEVQ
jgi:hypothetical protein